MSRKEGACFMVVSQNQDITLLPVLAMHRYAVDLQLQPGVYHCSVCVKSGSVIFRHHSYNLDAGLWCDTPADGDLSEQVLQCGDTLQTDLTFRIHDYTEDLVEISNNSYMNKAVFTCRWERLQ